MRIQGEGGRRFVRGTHLSLASLASRSAYSAGCIRRHSAFSIPTTCAHVCGKAQRLACNETPEAGQAAVAELW